MRDYWMFHWFVVEERYGSYKWKITCTQCRFFLDCDAHETPKACPNCGWCEAKLTKGERREHSHFGVRLISYLFQIIGYHYFQIDWRKERDGEIVYGATLWSEDEDAEEFNRHTGIIFNTVTRWRDYLAFHGVSLSGFDRWKKMDDLPGLEAIFQATGLEYDTELRPSNVIPFPRPESKP